jgi:hypothetical protein
MNRFSQFQRAGQSYRPGGRRQEFATKLAFGAKLAENTKLTETPLCPLWLFLNSLIRSIRAIRGYLRVFVPIRHYICRGSSTNQLLFMQNKPNFRKAKMNISILSKMAYKDFIPLAGYKNKPNQTQFKPKQTQFKSNLRKDPK